MKQTGDMSLRVGRRSGESGILGMLTAPALLARYRTVPAISSSPPKRFAGMKRNSEGSSLDGSRP